MKIISTMQNINIGDIIFSPFPFSDFSEFKRRPSVVVYCNKFGNEIIVAKITSAINKTNAINIDSQNIDFVLHKPSVIITNSLLTIEKTVIIKKIGSINNEAMKLILEKIKANFNY